MDLNNCKSSIVLNGMKIELLSVDKLKVDRKTGYIIDMQYFIVNDVEFRTSQMVIKMMALDNDLKIQKNLYNKFI